jgi:hypothetical protein
MAQQRKATTSSKHCISPPDINENTVTSSGKQLMTGAGDVDSPQPHRTDTNLNRFGFKTPSARITTTSAHSVRVAATGKSINRPHMAGGSTDYLPVVHPDDQTALVGKGDETSPGHLKETKTKIGLSSGKMERNRMCGRSFNPSDESLATRHRYYSLTELNRIKQLSPANNKQLAGELNCKRVKQTESEGPSSAKVEENPDTLYDSLDQPNNFSSENELVVSTRESLHAEVAHGRSVPKIRSTCPVAMSRSNTSFKTDLSLIKQKSPVTPNKCLKMIVNYRSDNSPKALLKSAYGTRDQFGAVKTGLLTFECDNAHELSKNLASSCKLRWHGTAGAVQSAECDTNTRQKISFPSQGLSISKVNRDDGNVLQDMDIQNSSTWYLILPDFFFSS